MVFEHFVSKWPHEDFHLAEKAIMVGHSGSELLSFVFKSKTLLSALLKYLLVTFCASFVKVCLN